MRSSVTKAIDVKGRTAVHVRFLNFFWSSRLELLLYYCWATMNNVNTKVTRAIGTHQKKLKKHALKFIKAWHLEDYDKNIFITGLSLTASSRQN